MKFSVFASLAVFWCGMASGTALTGLWGPSPWIPVVPLVFIVLALACVLLALTCDRRHR